MVKCIQLDSSDSHTDTNTERKREIDKDSVYVRNSHVTLKLTTIPKVCLINDNFFLDTKQSEKVKKNNNNEFAEDESVTECRTLFFLY